MGAANENVGQRASASIDVSARRRPVMIRFVGMRALHSIVALVAALSLAFVACASGSPSAPASAAMHNANDECPGHGGACVPIGACGRGQGHMGRESCAEGHDSVCCYPESTCGGPEQFECCGKGSTFRLTCEDGLARCGPNQVKKPIGQCFTSF